MKKKGEKEKRNWRNFLGMEKDENYDEGYLINKLILGKEK